MMTEDEKRELTRIAEAAVLRPGDRLIVRMPVGTTRPEFDELRAMLHAGLPNIEFLVIAGAEQLVVERSADA